MKLAVFFGGRSAEHDISIVTGLQLIENADKKHSIIPVYIGRNGDWFSGNKLLDIGFYKNFDENDKDLSRVYISPKPGINALIVDKEAGFFGPKKPQHINFDVAILCMHGLNGEDGTLQGLLELANIPYTSSGVLGAAAGMDKVLMKAAFKGADLPTVESICVLREDFIDDSAGVVKMLSSSIGYPIIVKPSNLGSSIGISKANNDQELTVALRVASSYDRRILVEKAIVDKIEINCSVLGFSKDVRASVCEQPNSWEDFLTFEEKYMRNSKNGSAGMKSLSRIIPAQIPDELAKEIQQLSVKIFKLFDCKGVVRIDYIYDTKNEELYVNEINTIPGSMSFYLWEPAGISFSTLIEKLIDFALKAHEQKQVSKYSFSSDVLNKVNLGAKTGK